MLAIVNNSASNLVNPELFERAKKECGKILRDIFPSNTVFEVTVTGNFLIADIQINGCQNTINDYEVKNNRSIFENDLVVFLDDENQNHLLKCALGGVPKDVASFYFSLYCLKFYSTNKGLWYYFSNHKWSTGEGSGNGSQCVARSYISNPDFCKYFKDALEYYSTLEIQDQDTKTKIKHLHYLIRGLRSTAFIDSILNEASTQFYLNDVSFEERLNKKKIIVFKNGVFDLKDSTFRDGKPEDYMSRTTGRIFE